MAEGQLPPEPQVVRWAESAAAGAAGEGGVGVVVIVVTGAGAAAASVERLKWQLDIVAAAQLMPYNSSGFDIVVDVNAAVVADTVAVETVVAAAVGVDPSQLL